MGSQGLTEKIDDENSADYSPSSCVVRWERFLPKMVVRVLLVEADDSTRQIIAALLRKCSYRVAAVDDGLKAWELLKERPQKIDLILTEVELPSISGYALLTLIMEHDVCKNIPVIMMSSQDSISTVYKCVLKGATDFLVKPIRKNELRNLWQHLWRKQSSNNTAGPRPPLLEATAENNALSNLSNAQRDRECVEKGTEAESSCGTLEINTEETHIVKNEERNHREIQVREIEGSRAVPNINASSEYAQGRDDDDSEVKLACENSSMEAIDLIGTFDKGRFEDVVSAATSSEFDVSKLLHLSLKSRSNPTDQNNDERHRLKLNHSVASAFSWYANKPHQPNNSTSPDHNPETHVATISNEKHLSVAEIEPELKISYPKEQEISHPIPTRDARLEQAADALASVRPGLPAPPSPPDHDPMDQRVTGEVDEGHVSPVHDHIGNDSNMCNENTSIHQSNLYSGNNGKINLVPANEEGFQVNNDRASSRRSLLREAALTKFRLKRKERCFEKKVRYESRKKLAEKRPRVRGQFVRQLPNEQ